MGNKRVDEPTGVETVGHEWDGIEELNNPLPRWWLWTLYATVIWSLVYVILYPAWPLLEKGTEGVLGWTSRGQLADEMSAEEARRAPILQAIAATPIADLPANAELMQEAVAGGAAAFRVHCVQCHGANAAGSEGYPNLTDDEWIWGGDLPTIEATIVHGIRHPGDSATRMSLMPAFGQMGILTPAQVSQVTDHVLSLSGQSAGNAAGAAVYAANCAVCHGPAGGGLRQFGAPSLNDAVWLYGGSRAAVAQQVNSARHGVMPAWEDKLDPATIRMLAAYVHSLGGGEAFAAPVAATPTTAPEVTPESEGTNGQQ
ncbi:cytochrome-c oxidase, cbb3-type subunit III [Alteraurantiacibacter buctensis]|uniref:Cbb3-type cytochrome c oxidase subunit n=1 Tax=Alteraurantiacibacter buctensis TaxID=1503981 RepID=A0A844Z3L8_9SPHN|nr:cytochrome-c oxidase, cbb3-type subunit III [Alteraurantiacibacter buctensis]MXO72453.1 cytochrome-c oxidase, cbb3-type subunit III [Alteraurantiacibacter buctensis]